MDYYSIENVILVAHSEELNYIATLIPSTGKLTSGAADGNTLLQGLIKNCNGTDPKTFQEFIAKPANSTDAEEIVAYYKTLENTKS
jgi:hypothetical protein